jgi:electron transfer flavoprotein beta subunit
VPDITAVTVDPATREAVIGLERVMNVFDAYAVGAALDIREQTGGTITVISAGPPQARDVLLRALATGADEAVLIDVPQHNDLDTLQIARVLADELKSHDFNLVLAGQSTDDYETSQVGPQLAEFLAWPHVSLVTHVDVEDGELRVHKDADGTMETFGVSIPAVVMVLSGRDGAQRFPTLRGMMAAKKKTIRVVEVGAPSTSARLEWSTPKAGERVAEGIILDGVPTGEAVSQLVSWLKERKLA